MHAASPTEPSSLSIESLDTSAPSPPLTEGRQHVYFPPTQRVDFIVHYEQTDFHCHTFVLHLQSSYFRHVFDALTPSSSPVPPPPSLPVATDGESSVEARAAVELSPVASPTASPTSPPQPAWRSVLSTATSYMHSALQRLTAQPEHSNTKRRRETMEEQAEDDEDGGQQNDCSTAKRYAHTVKWTTQADASSSSATLSSTDSPPTLCAHPGVRCVHIPAQHTVISGETITEADFDLFLRHLYFCTHYRFPPFLPANDLHLTATSPPATTLPPYLDLTEEMTSALLRTRPPSTVGGSVKLVWKETLLTLGQYFDCPALLARCEAVGMRRLEHVKHAGAYFDVLYAHQYGLREWKRQCVELILTDRRMRQRKEYALTALWERQLVLDILTAANERLHSRQRGKEEKRQLGKADSLRKLERAVARGLSGQ